MPAFMGDRLVFTKGEMFDLSVPLMKIMRRAHAGSVNFHEAIEPFMGTRTRLIHDREIRLLDIYVDVGLGFGLSNVIGVAAASNQLSIIQYLHANKEALHIESWEFVAAWQCVGDGSGYQISPEIYEFLINDERLVAFIKEEYSPEQGLLKAEQVTSAFNR